MRITKKKAVVVIAVAAVATAGAGGAFAYWTTGGTGTGAASAGTSTDFTVEQVGTVTNLFPGVSKTVNFKITNGATFAQYLTDVDVTVDPFTADANASEPACTEADFAIADIVVTEGQIAAGGNKTGTAKITLKNLDTNQDNCKGANVALTITAS
jgi:hypothetical protein